MRFAYLRSTLGTGKDKARWRTRYFLDSWLGHWTSLECFEAHRARFHASNQDRRAKAITSVANASRSQHDRWVKALLQRINNVADELRNLGEEPERFFETEAGQIRPFSYEERALNQLRRQQKQAKTPAFKDRYTSGFQFFRVPSFRGSNAPDWKFEDFADSICTSIVRSWSMGRTQNRLALAVRGALERAKVDYQEFDGEELMKHLSHYWLQYRDDIRLFYVSDDDA